MSLLACARARIPYPIGPVSLPPLRLKCFKTRLPLPAETVQTPMHGNDGISSPFHIATCTWHQATCEKAKPFRRRAASSADSPVRTCGPASGRASYLSTLSLSRCRPVSRLLKLNSTKRSSFVHLPTLLRFLSLPFVENLLR